MKRKQKDHKPSLRERFRQMDKDELANEFARAKERLRVAQRRMDTIGDIYKKRFGEKVPKER